MKVVGAILKNLNNEFLLQQRDEHAPSFKHHWTLFGGLVEQGEQPEAAVLRELKEEINLDPKAIQSLQLVQTNTQDNGILQYIFEIVINTPIDVLTLSEGEAMAFVTEGSLFERTFAFNIEEVLQSYLKSRN